MHNSTHLYVPEHRAESTCALSIGRCSGGRCIIRSRFSRQRLRILAANAGRTMMVAGRKMPDASANPVMPERPRRKSPAKPALTAEQITSPLTHAHAAPTPTTYRRTSDPAPTPRPPVSTQTHSDSSCAGAAPHPECAQARLRSSNTSFNDGPPIRNASPGRILDTTFTSPQLPLRSSSQHHRSKKAERS
jgi:hypothetical protein